MTLRNVQVLYSLRIFAYVCMYVGWMLQIRLIPAEVISIKTDSHCLFQLQLHFNRDARQIPLGRHLYKVLVFSLAHRQLHQKFKGDRNPNDKYVYKKELYKPCILIPVYKNRLKNGKVVGV